MARDLLSSSDTSDSDTGGAQLSVSDFNVNQDFARKFEYNKKREEKQRLEEKLGGSLKRKRDDGRREDHPSDESSSESEDEGELATAALDSEIIATIQAIRSKDPRVYDTNATFYSTINEHEPASKGNSRKEKPMHLQDYHRRNLLNGEGHEQEEEGHGQALTYTQEQEQLKRSIMREIQAAVNESEDDSEDEQSEADFLVAKEKPNLRQKEPVLDVDNANKDPETYLSNFMASRAWTQADARNLQPFESDDEEEERRADEFEEAYNMRFEDPSKSNEKLRSHARDLAAKYSVRREEENPRQRRRDAERAKKEAAKQEVREEKARLRKLRLDEAEERMRRIKRAAGLHSKDLEPEDWSRFVDEDWDDVRWEEEMQRRFGDEYYAEDDVNSDSEGEPRTKRKPKKPKFDDDIDIRDIVPDYDDENRQTFSLSEDDQGDAGESGSRSIQKRKKSTEEKKRKGRKDRRILEQLVDDQIQLELEHGLSKSKARANGFRYRETSPQSFGLTAKDILMANDSNLNEFAGLKKLAAFRDPDKKRKDQKHLGKKGRLRKWRKEVFGNDEGLHESDLIPHNPKMEEVLDADQEDGGVDIKTSGKKKRRRNNKRQKVDRTDGGQTASVDSHAGGSHLCSGAVSK